MSQIHLGSTIDSSCQGRNRNRLGVAVLATSLLLAACAPGARLAGAGTPSPSASGSSSSAPAVATTLQQEFTAIVGRVSPSVVVIEAARGLGSGVVFDTKGDIVTNAHVTGGSSRFRVTLADGRQVDGTLVGTFATDDLAVVHVAVSGLHPASFANSSKLVVGDIVLAVGNPLGLQSSVTEGIVSAVGRTLSEPGGAALPNLIQTSAPINPGNSGGALVDLAGDVVGIPTLAATDPQSGGSAPGIGFAIPSNEAVDIANQLIEHGRVVDSHRACLGIQTVDAQGAPGAVIYSVEPGSPAATAGMRVATPSPPSAASRHRRAVRSLRCWLVCRRVSASRSPWSAPTARRRRSP